MISSLLESSHTLMITDASIKNNVATSIAHIHIHNKDIIKTIYHTVNVLFSEAKLFVIKCSINQATNILGISKIVVITDLLHATWRIFNLSLHSYQIHVAFMSNELRRFFIKNNNNSIEFWEYSSHCKWSLHKAVDMETKCFYSQLIFSYKSSWDFSKKSKYNNILSSWKIIFQASDLKGQHFFDLCDKKNNFLELIYAKGRSWLKLFGYSNFPREDCSCLCVL